MSNRREVSMAIGANGSTLCTICLENVEINGSRSIARLQCDHLFHLARAARLQERRRKRNAEGIQAAGDSRRENRSLVTGVI